ncbi:MAG TPA: peptidylprolyl isomerase [Aestuariivirga sp.]|nr:peptidylprolyl isomerase [Alphaproteobacteria bacterium]HRX36652.1 peptidylprolyl isomerase [Aestuariivirga sp.]
MIKTLGLAALAAGLIASPALAASKLTVETSKGCSFDITLRPDLAPKHVAQITKLAKAGFYDGVVFHRVIEGFMAQTGDGQYGRVGGDTSRAGMGGSDEPDIPAEFTKEHYARGTVGMARTQDPNSANSQFFIMFDDGGFLDGQYTVWGQVDGAGMACVDQIKKGDQAQNGLVIDPDSMTKVTVK